MYVHIFEVPALERSMHKVLRQCLVSNNTELDSINIKTRRKVFVNGFNEI